MSHIYMEEDINEAFNLGLEAAVYILEQSIDFSRNGRMQLIERVKSMIEGEKVSDIDNSTYPDRNSLSQ